VFFFLELVLYGRSEPTKIFDFELIVDFQAIFKLLKATHTHTHTYIYIYILQVVYGVCFCQNTIENDFFLLVFNFIGVC